MHRRRLKNLLMKIRNVVKEIYDPFTADEISDQISKMLKLPTINADVEIVYQSIEGFILPVRVIQEIGTLQEIILLPEVIRL